MTYSHLDPAMQNRAVWNASKTVGTMRPLTQKQIWAIRFFLDRGICRNLDGNQRVGSDQTRPIL